MHDDDIPGYLYDHVGKDLANRLMDIPREQLERMMAGPQVMHASELSDELLAELDATRMAGKYEYLDVEMEPTSAAKPVTDAPRPLKQPAGDPRFEKVNDWIREYVSTPDNITVFKGGTNDITMHDDGTYTQVKTRLRMVTDDVRELAESIGFRCIDDRDAGDMAKLQAFRDKAASDGAEKMRDLCVAALVALEARNMIKVGDAVAGSPKLEAIRECRKIIRNLPLSGDV